MTDFETHPAGTAARLAEVEAAVTRANAAAAAAYEAAGLAIANLEIGYHDGIGGDWHPYNGPHLISAGCAAIRALATPDQTAALDRLIAEAAGPYVALLKRWHGLGCPNCNGDCSHANPPIYSCIMQETHAAILAASKKGGV